MTVIDEKQTSTDETGKAIKPLNDLVNFEFDGHPFFSEYILYDLLGKDDARTVLMFMRQLCQWLGTTLEKEQGSRSHEDFVPMRFHAVLNDDSLRALASATANVEIAADDLRHILRNMQEREWGMKHGTK